MSADTSTQPLTPAARLSDRILARLSRVTTSNRFIAEIDGLRFLAIFSVILLHVNTVTGEAWEAKGKGDHLKDPLGWLLHHGGVGVLVFFAISGFILAFPFALHHLTGSRSPRLKDYFLRRVTRLEPPYLVSLIGMYFALRLLGPKMGVPPDKIPQPEHLGASALYLHNLIFGEYSRVNGVAWSLEIEVQFYILAPLLARVFTLPKAARRTLMALLIIVGGVMKGAFDEQLKSVRLDMSLIGYLHCFLVGFLVADIFITEWKQRPATGSIGWDLVGLLGLIGIVPAGYITSSEVFSVGPFTDVSQSALFLPLFLVSNFLLFLAVFRGWLVRAFFTNRWIATIGGMCYTIYLIHQPMVHVLGKITTRFLVTEHFWVNVLIQATIIVPPVLVACSIYFILIERPCMYKDWPQRLWSWVKGRGKVITN